MVDNSFEILASRFWVLQSTVHQEPCVVKWIITTCVVLLNLLRMRLGRGQCLVNNMGFNLDNVLQRKQMSYHGRNPTKAAKAEQIVLADYFRN